MRRLDGRRALVTGAASGIGRAVALRLAAEGARVGLLDIDDAGLAEAAAEIAAAGGRALTLPADVRDEDQVTAAFGQVVAQFGGLEIVAGVAGIELMTAGDGRVHEIALEAWQRTFAVNAQGMFLTAKHGVRALLATGRGGSVILTGSPCGLYGLCSGEHAYSASKAAVHGLVRPMANDYTADGIRVNGVVPGFIDTPLNAAFTGDPEILAAYCTPIPMKRPGQPEEIAAVFAWLASDDASYVTGALIVADGGFTAV